MINQEYSNVTNVEIIYDMKTSNRIRYIFKEAMTILREREKNPNRPVEWHKMDWRINEMKPMADIAWADVGSGITVSSDIHPEFRLQVKEALKLVRDRLKNKNVYYIETEELVRRANNERLCFHKLVPNHIPT
jgi:ribosomal protein S7